MITLTTPAFLLILFVAFVGGAVFGVWVILTKIK